MYTFSCVDVYNASSNISMITTCHFMNGVHASEAIPMTQLSVSAMSVSGKN
jgi:hypothetical protein